MLIAMVAEKPAIWTLILANTCFM